MLPYFIVFMEKKEEEETESLLLGALNEIRELD